METEYPVRLEEIINKYPESLRAFLTLTGYNHFAAFKNLTREKINEAEIYMRQITLDQMPSETIKKAFGIFISCPERFQLVPGHIELILKGVDELKTLTEIPLSIANGSMSTGKGKAIKSYK